MTERLEHLTYELELLSVGERSEDLISVQKYLKKVEREKSLAFFSEQGAMGTKLHAAGSLCVWGSTYVVCR